MPCILATLINIKAVRTFQISAQREEGPTSGRDNAVESTLIFEIMPPPHVLWRVPGMNIVRKMALHPWLEEARQVNGVAKEDHTVWVPLILTSNSTNTSRSTS